MLCSLQSVIKCQKKQPNVIDYKKSTKGFYLLANEVMNKWVDFLPYNNKP